MSLRPARGVGAWTVLAGVVLAVTAAAIAVGLGLGNRFGMLSHRDGFAILPWLVYAGAAGAALSILGAVLLVWRKEPRRLMALALVGVLIGGLTAWLPYQARAALRASPPLPDVTTDMENPPVFVTLAEVRRQSGATNTTDYGPAKATLQRQHYPDIAPVVLPLPPDRAFERALAAVVSMKWTVAASEPREGRIEATDTTFWFGFKDDVVIRVTAVDGGSRVDIRSLSRIGRREAGTNAARVRALASRISGN